MQADAAEVDSIEIGPLIIKKDSHEVKTLNGKSIQFDRVGIWYFAPIGEPSESRLQCR